MAEHDLSGDASSNEAADAAAELAAKQLQRRQARLRNALEIALQSADTNTTTNAIEGALATLAETPEDWEGFDVLATALRALVAKEPQAVALVHEWAAHRRGCDPSCDAVAIVELAEAVERVAYLYRRSDTALFPKRAALIRDFAEHLEVHFGPAGLRARSRRALPRIVELEDWISKHSKKGAPDRFTTVGVVARIVHQAQLFGTRGDDIQRTRSRIDAALARARKAEQRLRQRASVGR